MNNKNWQFNFGVFLIILSTLFYVSLIVIPVLKLPVSTKLGITPVIIIIGEITFWIGGIFVGKEIIMKYKKYFNPLNWIKRNKSNGNQGN
jgi:hypothetical protein